MSHGWPQLSLCTKKGVLAEFVDVTRWLQDGVSHLSHLVGALVGSYCGYAMGQVDRSGGCPEAAGETQSIHMKIKNNEKNVEISSASRFESRFDSL